MSIGFQGLLSCNLKVSRKRTIIGQERVAALCRRGKTDLWIAPSISTNQDVEKVNYAPSVLTFGVTNEIEIVNHGY